MKDNFYTLITIIFYYSIIMLVINQIKLSKIIKKEERFTKEMLEITKRYDEEIKRLSNFVNSLENKD